MLLATFALWDLIVQDSHCITLDLQEPCPYSPRDIQGGDGSSHP